MDNSLKEKIKKILFSVGVEGSFPFVISRPKRKEWGHLSTNFPFLLAKSKKISPLEIAKSFKILLEREPIFEKIEALSPGFLNMFLSSSFLWDSLKKILEEKEKFSSFSQGKGEKVQVEFVSANPTGPLHIGHGRAAAVGDSIARLLEKMGYQVEKEYYINDRGGQIKRLAYSTWVRLKELRGKKLKLPPDGYRGEYLIEVAKKVRQKLNEDELNLLEEKSPSSSLLEKIEKECIKEILELIKKDLEDFGVTYHHWFWESSLYREGKVGKVLFLLLQKKYLYEKNGALWFRSSSLKEGEKDRVVRRKNGEYTYFAGDIAYHWEKFKRGYFQVVDIWGQDHIGYIPRLKAAIKALEIPEDFLVIIIYQLVTLLRRGEKVPASTREGKFITLREVMEEVGVDAAKFFLLSRGPDAHLEFDLELAKKQAPENPVYYVQYAHARIASILRKAKEKGIPPPKPREVNFSLLSKPEEMELIKEMALFPDEVKEAAENFEPHRLTSYLLNLASLFHDFYTKHKVIGEESSLSLARLALVQGVKILLKDGLSLLGISAPERM